jgi:hypothetical protein
MIAPGRACILTHALLDDCPLPGIARDKKLCMYQLEAILYGCVVNLSA